MSFSSDCSNVYAYVNQSAALCPVLLVCVTIKLGQTYTVDCLHKHLEQPKSCDLRQSHSAFLSFMSYPTNLLRCILCPPCVDLLRCILCPPCVAVWLCGCVAVWLCSCVAVWLCSCVAVWLCGCVAVWLCGCVAV